MSSNSPTMSEKKLPTSSYSNGRMPSSGGSIPVAHPVAMDHTSVPGPVAMQASSPPPPPPEQQPQSDMRDYMGEFMGTAVLVLFGVGTLAQHVLSDGKASTYATVAAGWGAAIAMGVIVSGRSGGHLNPAVTLAMALYRRFPLRKLPGYFLAQFLGSFIAAAILWGNYRTAIHTFERAGGAGGRLTVPPAKSATAGIFATYPAPFTTKAGQFFSEIIATAMLVFMIFALTDPGNPFAMGRFVPVGLFFVFFGIISGLGWQTGFALNPARDFAPRILTAAVGYGRDVWTASGTYFLVPFFAPFIGAIFGGFFYDLTLYRGTDSPVSALINKFSPSAKRRRRQEEELAYHHDGRV